MCAQSGTSQSTAVYSNGLRVSSATYTKSTSCTGPAIWSNGTAGICTLVPGTGGTVSSMYSVSSGTFGGYSNVAYVARYKFFRRSYCFSPYFCLTFFSPQKSCISYC